MVFFPIKSYATTSRHNYYAACYRNRPLGIHRNVDNYVRTDTPKPTWYFMVRRPMAVFSRMCYFL